MTLKMTIESRVRIHNELFIKFYKRYEKLVIHIECKGGQNCQNLPKTAIFANFDRFGRSKIRQIGANEINLMILSLKTK